MMRKILSYILAIWLSVSPFLNGLLTDAQAMPNSSADRLSRVAFTKDLSAETFLTPKYPGLGSALFHLPRGAGGKPKNHAPVFTSTPLTVAIEKILYLYHATAEDPENGAMKFSLVCGPKGMTVNRTSGLVQWTPIREKVGKQKVSLKVSDINGASATQDFMIRVSPLKNQPPVITSIPDTAATEGTAYQYQVSAHDPENGVLSFSLVGGPSGMTIGQSIGLVQWTPVKAQVGNQNVQIRVADPQGAAATQSYTIQVAALNSPPIISSIPNTNGTENAIYQYQVTAQDPEGGTLTYQLVSGPAGMNISEATGLVLWTPTHAQVGDQTVQIKVLDPLGAFASQSFSIHIAAVNVDPVITSTPNTNGTENAIYQYQVMAQDPEGGTLTYQLVSGPGGMNISATTGLVLWTPTHAQIGDLNVQLKVTDPQNAAVTQSFAIHVSALNLTPIITSVPRTFAKTTESYDYTVTAFDPEKQTVVFSLSTPQPVGMTIDPLTGIVHWQPNGNQIGKHQVVVRATDPLGAFDTQTSAVKVFDPSNDLEILSPTGAQTVRIGQLLTVPMQANYADALFAVIPMPKNASLSGSNFNFTPGADQEGIQTVSFRALYGDMQASTVIAIAVTRDNSAPVFTPIGQQTVQEGGSLNFTVSATDKESDALTYSAPGLNLANAFFNQFNHQFTFNPVSGQVGNYQVTFAVSDSEATNQIIVPIQVTAGQVQQQALDLIVDPVGNPTFQSNLTISGNITGQAGVPPVKQDPVLITGLSPASTQQGQRRTVQITGLNTKFAQGTSKVDFGDGIVVNSLTVDSATSAQANITVDKLARIGTRTVQMLGTGTAVPSVVTFSVEKGTASVTGTVIDPFTQQPLTNALVYIAGTSVRVFTDNQGRFTLTDVPTGSEQLVIALPNYEVQILSLAVGVNDTIDLQAPIKINALARPPNFAGSIPRAATVASVIDRGITAKGGGLTFEQAKAVVQDTMITVGGIEAGVFDSGGNQLNPKFTGAGEFSLTQEGVEAQAKGLLRGDVITLTDFVSVLTTAFAFPSGLSVGTVVNGFQQAVNEAWADPADPQSAMAIVLFNEGTNLSSSAPIITQDTRFNSFQIFLLTASFLTLNRVSLDFSIDSILKSRGLNGNALVPPPMFSRIVAPQEKTYAWFDPQNILGRISDWLFSAELVPSAFAQANGSCTPQPECAAADQLRKKTFTKVWNAMKANLFAESVQGALVSGAMALGQALAVEAILGFLLVGGITGGLAIGPILGTVALALIQGAVMVMMFKVVVGWAVAVTAASVETTPPEGAGSSKDSVGNFVVTFDVSPEHAKAATPAPLLGAPVLEGFKKRFAYHLYRVPDCVGPVDASTAEYMAVKSTPDFTDPVNKHNSATPFVGRQQFVVPPSFLKEGQNCFRIRAFQYVNQSDRFIVEGLEVYDTNNDDLLDFDELRNAGLGDAGTFSLYDRNGDNNLDRDEFNSLYKSRSAAPQDMQIVPGKPGVPATWDLRGLLGNHNFTPESFAALRNTAQQQVTDIPQRTLFEDSLVGLRTRIADFHSDQPFFHYRSNVDFAPQINTFLDNVPAFNLTSEITTAAEISGVQAQLNGDEVVARQIAENLFSKHLGQAPTAEQTSLVQDMVATQRQITKLNTHWEFGSQAFLNVFGMSQDLLNGKIGPGEKILFAYPDWQAGSAQDPVYRTYTADVTAENLRTVQGEVSALSTKIFEDNGYLRGFNGKNTGLQARIFDARQQFLALQGPILKSALQTTSGLSAADVEANFRAYFALSDKNGVAGLELAKQVNGKADALRALNNEMSQRRATPFDAIDALKKQKEQPVELRKIQKGISGLLNSAGFSMGVSSGLMMFAQSVQVLSSDFSPSCFTTPGPNRVAQGVFPPSFEPYPGLDDPNAILVGRKDSNPTNPRVPNGLLVREYPGADANIASVEAGFPAGFISIDSQERLYAVNLNSIDQFGGRIFRYSLVPVSGENGGPRTFGVAQRELVGSINYKSPSLPIANPASPVAMVVGPAFEATAQDGSTVTTQDLFVANTDVASGQKRILQVPTSQIDTIKSFYSDSLGNELNRYRIVGQPILSLDEFRYTGPSDMEVGPDLSLVSLDKPLLTANSVIMLSDEDIIWAILRDQVSGTFSASKVIQIPGRRWSGLAFDDQGKFYFADYEKKEIYVMKFSDFGQSVNQSVLNGSPFITTEILLRDFASLIATLEFSPGDIEMENVSNHPGGVLHISTDQGIMPINLPVVGRVGPSVRDIRVKRFSKEEDVAIETQTLFGTSVRTFRVLPSHDDLEILRIPLTVKRVDANGQEYWQDEFIFLGSHGATVLDFPIQ